jgi:hypothetical protein
MKMRKFLVLVVLLAIVLLTLAQFAPALVFAG